ncbi:MAG: ATP-dependent sacrificial sulfur transferase LarE [Candidatus Thermoplasmatota archaeon]
MVNLDEKLSNLKTMIKNMDNVAIAFSGGVDSTFLSKIAYDTLGERAIAITVSSLLTPSYEIEDAKRIAEDIGIKHLIVESRLEGKDYLMTNPYDRCYHCKKDIYNTIKEVAERHNASFILDGSVVDDSEDYRPGFLALKELEVLTPLRDVGFTKKEVRELSHRLKLDTWDKPSNPCLASRFPYGTAITHERLKQVDKAESFIRSLGVKNVRVRYHYDTARIEVDKRSFKVVINNNENIIMHLKGLGFRYITLDIEGYRRGSLNEGVVSR